MTWGIGPPEMAFLAWAIVQVWFFCNEKVLDLLYIYNKKKIVFGQKKLRHKNNFFY